MSLDALGTRERRQVRTGVGVLPAVQRRGQSASGHLARVMATTAPARQSIGMTAQGAGIVGVVTALLVVALPAGPAAANDSSPAISIGGATLPNLQPVVPPSGFAAGAAGLPDAAANAAGGGSHGTPPAADAGVPQAMAPGVPPSGWSEAEVRAAKVICQRALAGTDAQYTFVEQTKSGACGTPAPIELSGLGKGVAVSPPIVVNCETAASLHAWMKTHVNPTAKKRLGAAIIQINTMSSYACRNRYGAKKAPLSQHAFANAIDIRGFVTAKGQLLDVEDHWGPTEKEMAAHREANPSIVATQAIGPAGTPQGAAARGAVAQSRGATPPAGATPPIVTAALPQGPSARPPVAANAGQQGWATSVSSGPALMPSAIQTVPPIASSPTAAMAHRALKPTLPVFTKVHLSDASSIRVVATGQLAVMGAPSVQPGQPLDQRAHFLREIWQGACGQFMTVLGPEANRAHRNHFHVDMAQRKSGAYCQ